jgi:cytoskeletal protein CcmA (bactofilin family)
MTMFSRHDKPAEKKPDGAAPPHGATAEPTRSQATAQPIARPAVAPLPAQSQPLGVSVIGRAVKITGQIESTEDVQIDGKVEGDVRGVTVTVGPDAKVKGTVYGEAVELSGTVEGKIEAKRVKLTGTAHMEGDVIHDDIQIESGAYIDGHCRPEYGKTQSSPKATASANKSTN